jgi:hypothetical protein
VKEGGGGGGINGKGSSLLTIPSLIYVYFHVIITTHIYTHASYYHGFSKIATATTTIKKLKNGLASQ